jgi:Rrf2 family protein
MGWFLGARVLSLTRKTDYALVALTGLAASAPASLSAAELARSLHLPLPALRNILKVLAQHGIVIASQGATGGYRLARTAERITLAQVVHAIEGPARLVMCCGDHSAPQSEHCNLEDACRIKATVRSVHQRLVNVLEEVTLAQIVAGAAQPHDRHSTPLPLVVRRSAPHPSMMIGT